MRFWEWVFQKRRVAQEESGRRRLTDTPASLSDRSFSFDCILLGAPSTMPREWCPILCQGFDENLKALRGLEKVLRKSVDNPNLTDGSQNESTHTHIYVYMYIYIYIMYIHPYPLYFSSLLLWQSCIRMHMCNQSIYPLMRLLRTLPCFCRRASGDGET